MEYAMWLHDTDGHIFKVGIANGDRWFQILVSEPEWIARGGWRAQRQVWHSEEEMALAVP